MLNIMIANSVKRTSHLLDESTTLRSALQQAGFDYYIGDIVTAIIPGESEISVPHCDVDRSLSDLGVVSGCWVLVRTAAANCGVDYDGHFDMTLTGDDGRVYTVAGEDEVNAKVYSNGRRLYYYTGSPVAIRERSGWKDFLLKGV